MRKLLHHILFFQFVILIPSTIIAQDFSWLITAGGVRSDKGTHIVADENGYTYITGYYNEEANFGPFNTGFSYPHSKEVYVAKIDPDGNYVWVKNGSNYYDDRGLGLCLDPSGNVYVTGTCWGGLVFGSLSAYNSTSYTDQIFVVKLDNDGNEIWIKNAGNDDGTVTSGWNENGSPQTLYQDDHGQDIVSDSQGNIYVTGFLSNNDTQVHNATFDGISVPLTPQDSTAFVAKLSNDGVWQWVKTFGGEFEQRDIAITVDDEDQVYLTSAFESTQNFGPFTMTANGESDIYVTKVDPDGNFLWAIQAGSDDKDVGIDICYGHDNHMYLTGEFRDSAYFGNFLLDNYGGSKGKDIFVAKITKNGNWVWVNQAGSKKGSDRGNGIIANKQGNLFVTGQFSGNATFGAHEVASNGDSVTVFIAGIDTLGAWRWVKTGGGPGYDRGNDVACDEACNVWATGYYDGSAAFETFSVNTNFGKEVFNLKITDACFGYSPEEVSPEDEECTLLEANVITMNGDNINDVFYFAENCNIPIDAKIINRWGNVVFETNDPTIGWDGTNKNGKPVDEGVYFYRVTTNFAIFPDEEVSGFIHVLR